MTVRVFLSCLGKSAPEGSIFALGGEEFCLAATLAEAAIAILCADGADELWGELCRLDLRPDALPVICVAALTADEETALLDAGVMLCLARDTAPEELRARMRALLRLGKRGSARHHLGALVIDPGARQASWSGLPLQLRPVEFDLLVALAERVGEAVPTSTLLNLLWPDQPGSPRRLAVHLHNLRSRLEAAGGPPLVNTLPGMGTCLSVAPPIPPRRLRRR